MVVGLVDQHTVEFALNWLCSWRARTASISSSSSSPSSSSHSVLLVCADAASHNKLEREAEGADAPFTVLSLRRDVPALNRVLSDHGSDSGRVIVDTKALLARLLDEVQPYERAVSADNGKQEEEEEEEEKAQPNHLLAAYFELVGGLAGKGVDVLLMHDMRQVWVGNPLDFVHTHPDRHQMDDLQTIGHPTRRTERAVAFTKVSAKRSAPAPHPCGALVYVAGGSPNVVDFFAQTATNLREARLPAAASQEEEEEETIASLSAALPGLCAAVDVGALARSNGLKMRSLDPDLFHPDSADVFRRHETRAYKLRTIPIIPPVVAYFPPLGPDTPERVFADMQRHHLWLRDSSGCRQFNASAWPAPSPPPDEDDIRVVLKILTFKRPHALERLLRSLENAQYDGDRVNMDIYVDYDEKQNANVLRVASEARWSHGRKRIINHGRNVGLIFQWLGSFIDSAYVVDNNSHDAPSADQPSSWVRSDLSSLPLPPLPRSPLPANEFAYIMEDDLEQSVYYYRWIKMAIRQYHANKKHYTPRQGKSHKLPLHTNSTPFYYPLIGSWGALVFPRQWEEFLYWYRQRQSDDTPFKPYIDGFVTTGWMKAKPFLWTPWIIRFAAERGYTNLFASYENAYTMSVNHLEDGLNYKKGKPSHKAITSDDEQFFRMPPAPDILAIGFCGDPIGGLQELDGRYDASFADTAPERPNRRTEQRNPT